MPQPVHLSLPGNVRGDPARILYILVPMQYFPYRFRLITHGIPHVDGEDERITSRVVFKNDLARGVGKNAAVPIKLSVDANRRKGGRQRARCQYMTHRNRSFAAVEVAHLAG